MSRDTSHFGGGLCEPEFLIAGSRVSQGRQSKPFLLKELKDDFPLGPQVPVTASLPNSLIGMSESHDSSRSQGLNVKFTLVGWVQRT